jgi:hypothetical protein
MDKIIDLDLDFFQNDVVRDFCSIQNGKNGLKHWCEEDVRDYLENHIGLSTRVRGRIFKTHDKAFYFWRELVKQNRLKIPFEVDHLDAHSDMGFGNNVWLQMINSYMHLPIKKRSSIPLKQMNEGNYIIFAFAMGWISKFHYIHHEKYEADLLACWFKDFDISTNKIQMVACDNLVTEDFFDLRNKIHKIVRKDETIDFQLSKPSDYKNINKISYLSVSVSPNYICPDTQRNILPIIEEYIDKI